MVSHAAAFQQLTGKTVLLIDDISEMRQTIRSQLISIGLERITMARNVKEALAALEQQSFDIIICDYNLGAGTNGQQFLELIRNKKLISDTTVFLMVTAEAGYQQVATALEYAPDTYLLKPFTAQQLGSRLERAFAKKRALAPLYTQLGPNGDSNEALRLCQQLAATCDRQYLPEILRIHGELLLKLERYDEALAHYETLLQQRSVPWAQLGKSKALIALEQQEKAKTLLQEIIAAYPSYTAAYDLLAQIYEKEQDFVAAQKVLAQAYQVAPTTPRERKVAALAMTNQDFDTAEKHYRHIVKKERTSLTKALDDYFALSKCYLHQGKTNEALATAKEIVEHFETTPEVEAAKALIEYQAYRKEGKLRESSKALQIALAVCQEQTRIAPALALEVANACLASGEIYHAKQIIKKVVENHTDQDELIDNAYHMLIQAGLEEEGEALVQAPRRKIITLNNEAVQLASRGDVDQAVDLITAASDSLPNNAQIAVNAALILLKRAQLRRDRNDLERAGYFLERANETNPNYSRLAKARETYKKVADLLANEKP